MDDSFLSQRYKTTTAIITVLDLVGPVSNAFRRLVRLALRGWSEADYSHFHTTTYPFLRVYYLANDIPMMRQVVEDISNGLV